MSNDKTESNIRKSIALGLYRMEVVEFKDDTYQSIITPSSDKKEWCTSKGNLLIAQQGKYFWRKQL